jgi:opacity protein-like surface antigen
MALLVSGCAGFQFGQRNFGRAEFGGGAPVLFGDALARSGNDVHGDRWSGLAGGVQAGTVVYDSTVVSADAAVGPNVTGMIGPDNSGTWYTANANLRLFVKITDVFEPFIMGGVGVGYADVQPDSFGTDDNHGWVMPLQTGIGGRFNLSDKWSATGEYRLDHTSGLGDSVFDRAAGSSHGVSNDLFLFGVEYRF